jgi:hypothetical protein
LAEVISEPFLVAKPASLTKAVAAMQAVIVNCWPRIPQHRYKILRAITMCWMNITAESKSQSTEHAAVESLKAELKQTVLLLSSVGPSTGTQMDEDARALSTKDGRLNELFALPSDST